jgi:lipopolysaccharide export LptBFGC system permease protein LptF
MPARYILGCLAGVFLVLGGLRVAREHGRIDPAARTWLLIGAIFLVVGVWLWVSRRR